MWWQLWGSPQPGKLSDKVQKALIVQFGLDRERVDGLRCVQKSAKLNGRPIRNIRVFDPAQLGPKSPPIRRYEDLESRLDAVLFDGYIEKFGLAHLSEAQPSGDAGLQKLPDALRSALVTRYSVDPREVGRFSSPAPLGTKARHIGRQGHPPGPDFRPAHADARRSEYPDLRRLRQLPGVGPVPRAHRR